MLFWFCERFEGLIEGYRCLVLLFDVKAKTEGGNKRQQGKKERKTRTVRKEIENHIAMLTSRRHSMLASHDISYRENKSVLCYELISIFGCERLIKRL